MTAENISTVCYVISVHVSEEYADDQQYQQVVHKA